MVEDIDPYIIGITESWANIDITDAELGLTGYVMFSRDSIGRRGVILYIKESIQVYEIKLEREVDFDKAVWYNIVTGNSTLTVGLVYQSPNINEEDNTKKDDSFLTYHVLEPTRRKNVLEIVLSFFEAIKK